MARRSPNRLGLALAVVLAVSSVQANASCRTGCRGASQTFKYAEGTTYKYNLDSKIEITLSSAEGQKSLTEIKALVLLTQQPQCNQILRLQNVQIIGSDGKKYTRIPDIDKPISLNFNDGQIDDSLCTTQDDTQNSLNIKRAVASLFQTTLKSGHETDVFGLCPTEVTTHKEGAMLVIQKQRNLNRCAYREHIKQDFLSTAFNPHSDIKSSPILNADYIAKLRIKNGILNQAIVTEHYLYVPFSVGNNGAKASIETKLQFVSQAKDNPQVKVTVPKSVIFENPHPINSPTSNVNSILAAVQATAKTVGLTVADNTANEFINLVRVLRVSNKDDLLAVYNQVRAGVGFADKVTGKKLFLDALLRAGNADTVIVAIELLKNREFNKFEEKLLYLSLPLVRHASESTVEAAAGLLDQPKAPREAYLGVSTLAGHYCRQHDCQHSNGINKLTQKLIQKLGDGKAANKDEENDMMFVLKSLRNINQLNDGVLGKISAIAQDKLAPTRLRVAALETYLADPCKDKLRESALGILKDIQQDSELRIKAYLALTRCPNAEVGNAIKALLDNEPSYQVGGFIVSHVRSIRSSSNPDRDLAKKYLGFLNLPNKYPVDLRKWSHSNEFSYSIDSLGIANSIDANLIYSQDSFLPRSVSMNLTADVFGHSFNFLEIETRQENLDKLIEHYVGPKGILRSQSPEELWNARRQEAETLVTNFKEKISKSLRSKRDVSKAELDSIAKQAKIKMNSLENDLDIDVSLKAFGSELMFVNINEDAKKWTPDAISQQIADLLATGNNQLKAFDETLRTNLMFLDGEFAYPTSSGFPLRLGVEGSANIQVKAKGAVDIMKLFSEGTTLKINLIPSANIEVAGRLTVDALLVENGLKVISNLHTATGGDVIADITSKTYDVKFALPVDKLDVISVKHDIVFHTREIGSVEKNSPMKFAQNKDFSICLDQLEPVIGLTFCTDINGPNLAGQHVPILPYPLSGDAKIAIFIEKEDLSMYHFRHVFHTHPSERIGFETTIAALDKKNQKKLALEIEAFASPQKRFKVTLISPIKAATLEGLILENPQEHSAWLRFEHDGQEFFGKIGVGVSGSPSKSIYRPILEYKTPQVSSVQIPEFHVEGQVIVERNGPNLKYTFDNVRIVSPNSRTVTVNGNVGRETDSVYSDVTVSDGSTSASIKGRLQVNPELIKLNAEVKNSINPQANFNIKGELSRKGKEEVKGSIQLIHGNDLNSKTNILTISTETKVRNQLPDDVLIDTKNKLTYPLLGLDLKFDFQHDPKHLDYDVHVQYDDFKVGSELNTKWDRKVDGLEYDVELGVWGLGSKLDAKSKRTIAGDFSNIQNSLEINGKKVEVSGKVKNHIKPQDVDISADLIVKIPQHAGPIKVVAHFKLTANDLDAAEKITSGPNVYADVFIKANRAGNINGDVKITLKDKLIVNGQVKAVKGVGSGDITVQAPQIPRTVKLDTTFTVQKPTFNLLVNIYPIFNEDKTKKIVLSTHTRATLNDIDTKNKIDVFGNKIELNVKGQCQGEFITNGKINGEAEFVLLDDGYVNVKLNRDLRTVNDVSDGQVMTSLEIRKNKNTPGSKLQFKGIMKATNFKERIYDLNWYISGDSGTGKDINLEVNLKRHLEGGEHKLDVKGKLHGSVLPDPLEASLEGKCDPSIKRGQYQARTTWGRGNMATAKTNYDVSGEGRPISGSAEVDVQSTSNHIKSIKLSAHGSVLKSQRVELKGGAGIQVVAPEGEIANVNVKGELQAGEKSAQAKGTIQVGQKGPVSVDFGYDRSGEEGKLQLNGYGGVGLPDGKTIKGSLTVNQLSKNEGKLQLRLETPFEKVKVVVIDIANLISEDKSHVKSNAVLTVDGKSWTVDGDVVLSEITPSFNLQSKSPEGKLAQVYGKITKFNGDQLGGEVKLVNQYRDFILEGSLDATVPSVDNFHIKITAHCPTLNLDKVTVDAQNTAAAKTGRKIQVIAKSNGKNILAGSTSYTSRQEQGKMIVEGSGTFKVKEETQSANFKYIRQNLSKDKDGEIGMQISFDAGLGNKAVDAEFKMTNKQFRILNSYCEEKKECAHIEIDSKTNKADLSNYEQETEIAVDLRKLGLSHEFGLKAVTTRKGYVLDHTVDVHFQSQANNKYQYSFYVHPKEAGVSLTTPKRIIALEAKADLPENIPHGGKGHAEVVLYLDKKNQPNQKTALVGWLNVDPQRLVAEGEVKFTNPALGRPLSISGNSRLVIEKGRRIYSSNLNVDIFAQPNQKLTVTVLRNYPEHNWEARSYQATGKYEIKSAGLGIDIGEEDTIQLNRDTKTASIRSSLKYNVGSSKYNSNLNLEASPRQASVLVRLLNLDLLKIDSKLQISEGQQIIDTDFARYGGIPATTHLEVKNWNSVKFYVARKNTPNDKLMVSSALIPGEIADFRAEVLKGGTKNELVHATIKLDSANFLKSDYGVQSENIKNLVLKPMKESIISQLDSLKDISSSVSQNAGRDLNQLKEITSKAIPNLVPLKDYYIAELQKIKSEILADQTIKELSELVHKIITALSQSFGETFTKFSELVENVARALQSSSAKILEVLEKSILPKVKMTLEKIIDFNGKIIQMIVDVTISWLVRFGEILEKYQPELKQLAATIGEISQDIGRVVIKAWDDARALIIKYWTTIVNEIKALPILDEFKATYEQFQLDLLVSKENLVATLRDLVQTAQDLAPLEELKVIIKEIGEYLEKKINGEQVDDLQALDRIIQAILTAIKRVTTIVVSESGNPELDKVNFGLPTSILGRLPKFAAVRFSPVTYLLHEEFPNIADAVVSLVNKPRNWIPPFPLYGVIAQGQHIFTFDGKHLTFPGSCNYLLARDALDGNFTVAGTYSNGLLTAITLGDGKDMITLRKGGQVLLNNAASELPVRKLNLAAFRDYEKIILHSTAGIEVICGPQLDICGVSASGFYHGRLRGLLGNGNNEPYDDFTTVTGKIVSDEGEFGNSFKLQSSCAPIKTVDHHTHHPSPSCDKLFGWESDLRLCYPFVKTHNFKMACEHGVAAGVKDTEKSIAMAYVAACNRHAIPVRVPEEYIQCLNGDKPTLIGEIFSVKTPAKSADIVLLVDTVKSNEIIYKELITPLVVQLTNDLRTKGITDLEFHLILYGGDNQWPSHVTVGGKLVFKGKAPVVKFSENPKETLIETGCKQLDDVAAILKELRKDLKLALGLDLQARTYDSGLSYPYRPNAVKSIIAVTSSPCHEGKFFAMQLLRSLLYRNKLIHLNLITPFEKMIVKDPKHNKDIVGFNDDSVVLLGQKSRAKANSELRKELDYDDFCVDFTVENYGNVFVSDNFLTAKGPQRKQFVQVTSHTIVDQFTNVELGLDCKCKYMTPFTASNVCKVVNVVNKKPQAKRGKN